MNRRQQAVCSGVISAICFMLACLVTAKGWSIDHGFVFVTLAYAGANVTVIEYRKAANE